MIKTMLIPQTNNIQISIPIDFIGKKVNIFCYADDEVTISNEIKQNLVNKKKPSDYFGTLDVNMNNDFHSYLKQSREEWE